MPTVSGRPLALLIASHLELVERFMVALRPLCDVILALNANEARRLLSGTNINPSRAISINWEGNRPPTSEEATDYEWLNRVSFRTFFLVDDANRKGIDSVTGVSLLPRTQALAEIARAIKTLT